MKKCSVCKIVKPRSDFYSHRGEKDGLHCDCKDCARAAARARHALNREKGNAVSRQWYAKNKSKSNASTRAYHVANSDHIRKIKRENKQSRSAHYAAKQNLRHARKLQATVGWADQWVISEIYELATLRSKATGVKWQVDHIVPLRGVTVCGLHVENN